MQKFRDWISRHMYGRYGVDQLERVMLYVEMGLLIVSMFVSNLILTIITTLLLIWIFFRMLSRNTVKRAEENRRFLEGWGRVKTFFTGGMRAAKDREHAYFKCPNCGQKVRVPRGKGHIQITCPRCHTQFIRNT
ncbi:MAG: hypothetical protein ACI4ET_06430 [Bilifractor sp.]